jgi:hypothetical protein
MKRSRPGNAKFENASATRPPQLRRPFPLASEGLEGWAGPEGMQTVQKEAVLRMAGDELETEAGRERGVEGWRRLHRGSPIVEAVLTLLTTPRACS